jgi:sulfofructose kinase
MAPTQETDQPVAFTQRETAQYNGLGFADRHRGVGAPTSSGDELAQRAPKKNQIKLITTASLRTQTVSTVGANVKSLPPEPLQIATDAVESLAVRATPSMADVVGVGLNAFDTIIRVPHFPAFNSKVQILSCHALPGGQVASAVIACQRWGLRARYVGKIGDDFAGRFHREEFAREGVEAHLIEVPRCESQIAYILVEQSSGERTVLWKRDPRLDLEPREILSEWITQARLLHVDGHPSAPAAEAARIARQAKIPVTADLDNVYAGVEVLLQYVDFLISSRDFPERLTNLADLTQSLPEIARRFGCRITGATLGSDGVLAWDGQHFHYCPAFRVATVDTTGAGDIFHGAFAYALLQGQPLDRLLEFSCAAAALNCMAEGARGGIQPVAAIEEFVRTGDRHGDAFDPQELQARSACAQNAAREPTKP